MELTEDDAERSGSVTPGGFAILPSPGLAAISDGPVLVMMSGDGEEVWGGFDGGTGNGALAIREMGERLEKGDGLALDRGESGLWDIGDSLRM